MEKGGKDSDSVNKAIEDMDELFITTDKFDVNLGHVAESFKVGCVVAWICNCSDCSMRGNTHFVVPKDKFALQAGAGDFLTTYTFGTHTAKHTFCKVCGITSFYIPRSNPDGVAVTAACVGAGTLAHVEYRKADGRNWEQWIEASGISEFSKPKAAE
uniref:Uncharacterized protein n=1 Tax=Aegilops tauschii TaxID=37682 RepID=M8CCJ1_AEGTA